MKKFLKMTAAFSLGLSLAFGLFSPAQAAPDTSVSNKQNFSTDVIYQIFTDRFSDGNPANNPTGAAFDGTCTNLRLYCGGDWQGIINKINDGYLTGMGVTAIWISQPVENIYSIINYSGVNNTAYHGYWAGLQEDESGLRHDCGLPEPDRRRACQKHQSHYRLRPEPYVARLVRPAFLCGKRPAV